MRNFGHYTGLLNACSSLRLRNVPTACGVAAVQIVTKRHDIFNVVKHLGSAQFVVFEAIGHQTINESTVRLALDLHSETSLSKTARRQVAGSESRILVNTIRTAYDRLGFTMC